MPNNQERYRLYMSNKQLYELCTELLSFISVIEDNIAIFEVYNELAPEIKKSPDYMMTYIEDSQLSIEQMILIETMKIFDNAFTFGHTNKRNCSFHLLTILIKEEAFKDYQQYITRINTLCEKYEKIGLKTIRNKKLAHHDKATLDKMEITIFQYSDITALIAEGKAIINDILFSFCHIEYANSNKKEIYKKAIRSMINGSY